MEQPSYGLLFFAIFLPLAVLLMQTGPPLITAPAPSLAPPSPSQSGPSDRPAAPFSRLNPAAPNPSAPNPEVAHTGSPTSLTPAVLASPASAPSGPTPLAPRTFHDPKWKLSFAYPGDWIFALKDGEISTFHLDARSAPHNSTLRAVTAFPENPFPASTFSGGYVYFSVTPHSSAAACSAQATYPAGAAKPAEDQIAGIPFAHGHDQQRQICTTERDDTYTTFHNGACYRFDLAINNFCGGEVSGVKDITPRELDQVRARLESILSTVQFDPK